MRGNCWPRIAPNTIMRCIVTDGVFSMDGDLAPLGDLLALANEHDAWLMSDDAHGLGVVGGGRGSSFAGNTHIPVPLQMGTLSKAVGSYGGYLCASAAVIDLIRNRARTLIYSTGLPPACVAAAIAALDLIEREPGYAALPVHKAKAFTKRAGLPEAQSPIVPVIVGDEEATLAASRLLADEGYLAAAIRPPTVPAGTSRLRLTFTAQHPDEDIVRLADLVRERILNLMSAYFVTSTGTDIGKTFVTAGLIRYLREAGQAVDALKPVVSGYDTSVVETSDPAVLLKRWAGRSTPAIIERIAPWRFRAPLSPDLAAAREGRNIDFGELIAFSRQEIAAAQGMLFIEGVGGIMVPLDAERTVLDWMAALANSAAAGGRRLSRHYQPHAHRARRAGGAPSQSRGHRGERKRAQSGRA